MGRRGLVPVFALLVAAPALAGASSRPEQPQVKYNRADLAAARAAVMRRSDLPGSGWKGGRVKPDLGPDACSTYHPKQADLVVTGAAASDFQRAGYDFSDLVQLM